MTTKKLAGYCAKPGDIMTEQEMIVKTSVIDDLKALLNRGVKIELSHNNATIQIHAEDENGSIDIVGESLEFLVKRVTKYFYDIWCDPELWNTLQSQWRDQNHNRKGNLDDEKVHQ